MNIRVFFGKILKLKVTSKIPSEEIGSWAFSFYWENILTIDSDFEDILLTLNKMELGPEFAFTYEELEKIADNLIAGKEVKL